MDEVDIENVEELNDLEARLYAQIHHEATDEPNIKNGEQNLGNDGNQVINTKIHNNTGPEQTFNTTTNRILTKRYWANGENAKQRFIRNPFKTFNKSLNQVQQLQKIKNPSSYNLIKEDEPTKLAQNNKSHNACNLNLTSKSESDPKNVSPSLSPCIQNKESGNVTKDQYIAKHNLPPEKSNLKLNPVADWIQRKKKYINKNSNSNRNITNTKNYKNFSINIKQGLFARQQEKLQKAKRIEEKRQKSKKAKILSNKIRQTEVVINLDSDNESNSSDVVVIPTATPPTFIIDDSGDEDKISITMAHEENALDSSDVQMSSTTTNFIKPQQTTKESGEKRFDNSSRCTSPCSIQSSDDFIVQIDRSRLVAGASGMADDEDLLVLTSDINSLLEVPDISKQVDDQICLENEKNTLDRAVEHEQEQNMEDNDSLEFVEQTRLTDYRVDQSQFRALDVYESESDINDGVYSKGANKSTVIRQIDTSSDEEEHIGFCNQRVKRLRKRQAYNENDNNKVLCSSMPFISKGAAVERHKPIKRSRTLSSSSSTILKRKSENVATATDHMSDTEFIDTLNNLAQGQEGDEENQVLEEVDESDTENIPTAREIAEKILAEHREREKSKKPATEDVAIPTDILKELEKAFETIDELDRQTSSYLSTAEDTFQISDSSDSERDKNFIYRSLPGEDAQIIEYSPDTSKKPKYSSKTNNENGSPIYNVIYSRGQTRAGGIGWNDEMRKFYNDSWNGEHFILSKVLQKMNPDKNLWKIYTQDRFSIKSNKRSNIKCTNCCEFGHMRSKCKRPRKPMICYMCGNSGHLEPRCPNTICLRCGNKTQVFTKTCNACYFQNRLTCPICKIRGHSLDYCPDKWRRYHSTTEANIYLNNKIEYNSRKYCCICGARGHISDNCRSSIRFSEYPPIASTIKSHEKCYGDIVIRTPHNGIPMNLMYKPCEEYKFNLIKRTSFNKYYGRFLNAVGMNYLFNRKSHINSLDMNMKSDESTAKRIKRQSKQYEANPPYLKTDKTNRTYIESNENAANQVQEITESGNNDQEVENDVTNIEDETAMNEFELISSTSEEDDMAHLQLNIINERPNAEECNNKEFKSPNNVTTAALPPSSAFNPKNQTELVVIHDSDSNYSFSEHFDVPPKTDTMPVSTAMPTWAETSKHQREYKYCSETGNSIPKSRQMEILPDYIPLIDSTRNPNEQQDDCENLLIGISKNFVATQSDDVEIEENRRNSSPLSELPCEAKIYLSHFHSKFLLSPAGNEFLVKTTRTHKLKARLDLTSVGRVLILFGLPTNQDEFQKELLMKYREIEDKRNQKQVQSSFNVPKRTYVLIRFLRENITQLMNNLGNVNHLLKRLQFLERQQTKSGNKLAEKVRRLLNMILVGQAGLQNGTMHLDKLLMSLKTLLNDVSEDVAPPKLRLEITDHWKVIFSAYRHDNYQKLVDAYNKLISKNRIPHLNIDPALLGQKVLDTSLSEEQKQNLEQVKTPASVTKITDSSKQIMSNALNHKNTKLIKRKQMAEPANTSFPSTTTKTTANKTKTSTLCPLTFANVSQIKIPIAQADNNASLSNIKTKSTSNNTPSSHKFSKGPFNTLTTVVAKATSSETQTANKSKQTRYDNFNEDPEKRSTVSATIKNTTDKWKSTCDNLLTEISSDKPISHKQTNGERVRESKLPSTFWSRESMRYLNDCIRLSAARKQIVEKLRRVQNKSKNGQLSYNDYLAVIKLHTALNGK